MTLIYLIFSVAPLAVAPPMTPPLLPHFCPSCSWKVLQDLGSDHLPILLTVPLSPIFHPSKRLPSFNFQKACWDALPFSLTPTVLLHRNARLFLSPLLLLSALALNAAKSSIPFSCIKRHPKAWWSAEAEEAVSERHRLSLPLTEVTKITMLTSLLPDVLSLSSPRPRLKHGR